MSVAFELITDTSGLITDASPEAAAVLGIREGWLVHKPLASFVAAHDRQAFRSFLVTLPRTGRRDLALQPRRGDEFHARLVATRRDGQVTWDVEAETELREPPAPNPLVDPDHQQLFSRLLTRLPHGILVVDRNLAVVYANPAARRAIGDNTRAGEPVGDPWPDYPLREHLASLFSYKPKSRLQLVHAGDRIYQLEGLAAANVPTATLLIEDVTDRENARAAERRFIENAAHELRTPLAAITSVVEVLESGAKDHPPTRDSFLAHLRAHSERLTRLTTSLLALARIQTGQQHPQLDIIQLAPLLAEVADRLFPQKGVEVTVASPDKLAVLADRDLLVHALENVGANAVKHTDHGSIALEARDLGTHAEIEIRDTGRGMTGADAGAAFDRFYRGPARDNAGFGLGLAIADEAVRATGGTIRLDSSPGRGTRVRVTLPGARVLR